MLRLHNTLTRTVEPVRPLRPGQVSMYSCGPTVYRPVHIGNLRSFLLGDLIRRALAWTGVDVRQVMNITDVGHMTDEVYDRGEDKMLLAAADEGLAPSEIAAKYEAAFHRDSARLGIIPAEAYPRASGHIAEMIDLIGTLIERGHAYADSGTVYYDVTSFPGYGRLSRNSLDQLRAGHRLETLDHHKRHPADFILWKAAGPRRVVRFDSPWGEGYPGWHIECSTMALEVLGKLAGKPLETIDIHTGGEDNIFPHHECEIAQTCGATGRDTFARFWMHTRFLLVEGEKMSKSKGNFFTVRDVLEGKVTGRPVDPAVLRFELMKAHYRSNANFTKQGLEDSAGAVKRIRDAYRRASTSGQANPWSEDPHANPVFRDFVQALSNDLNISKALAVIFKHLPRSGALPDDTWLVLWHVDRLLGVVPSSDVYTTIGPVARQGATESPEKTVEAIGDYDDDLIQECKAIDDARLARDYATADALRQKLIDAGFEVQQINARTVARRKLA
jgi:cysteinyl-tRNA synthetase